MRTLTYGLLKMKKKEDFSSAHIKVMEDFYNRSFFYQYLLNYTGTIMQNTDLGDLWYREFYLELSKRLQVRNISIHLSTYLSILQSFLIENSYSLIRFFLHSFPLCYTSLLFSSLRFSTLILI